MSTSPFLPPDVRESDLDPVTCSRCSDLEDKIEELQDCLSDALEFLVEYEVETRTREFGTSDERRWRVDLQKTIAEAKRLT